MFAMNLNGNSQLRELLEESSRFFVTEWSHNYSFRWMQSVTEIDIPSDSLLGMVHIGLNCISILILTCEFVFSCKWVAVYGLASLLQESCAFGTLRPIYWALKVVIFVEILYLSCKFWFMLDSVALWMSPFVVRVSLESLESDSQCPLPIGAHSGLL